MKLNLRDIGMFICVFVFLTGTKIMTGTWGWVIIEVSAIGILFMRTGPIPFLVSVSAEVKDPPKQGIV